MAKFGSLKVGDICKIIGNSNLHGFIDGEEVELYEICEIYDNLRMREYGFPFRAKTLERTSIVREIDLEKVDNMEKMKEFTKSDLQEYDEAVFRNGNKNVYYQGDFRGKDERCVDRYKKNLIRDDSHTEFDIMQVIRNKEVIWDRVEKSPIQIELESLELQQREIADKIAELSKKV